MFDNVVSVQVSNSLMLILITSAPVLLAAVVVGVLVGLIQALTQIQDQTLPQAVKLIVTLLVIMLAGPIFAKNIANQASTILDQFPLATR